MSSLTSLCPGGFISTRVVSNACNCGLEHFSNFLCRKSLEQRLGQVHWLSAVILPELENSPTNPDHQFGFDFQSEDLPSGLPKAFIARGPGSIPGRGTRIPQATQHGQKTHPFQECLSAAVPASPGRHLGLYRHFCGPQFLLLNGCPTTGALNLRWGKKNCLAVPKFGHRGAAGACLSEPFWLFGACPLLSAGTRTRGLSAQAEAPTAWMSSQGGS